MIRKRLSGLAQEQGSNKMMRTKKNLTILAVAFFAAVTMIASVTTDSYAQANSGAKIITVDRNSFFVDSAAAKDIAKQVKTIREGIEADLNKKMEGLTTERDQLAGQQTILTQDVFEKKAKQLQERFVALQAEAENKQRQLQAAVAKAQAKILETVSPILDDILKEKKANLMLERGIIVKGAVDIDVTATVMNRLNDKLPKVKVELAQAKAGN